MNSSKNQPNIFQSSLDRNLDFADEISSLAFKALLINELLKATSDYLEISGCPSEPIETDTPVLTKETMPLHRTKEIKRVIYVSAIALKLQKAQQQSPMKIAQAIVPSINLSSDFTIDVLPPGWIQFHLKESKLAIWLQGLNQGFTQSQRTEKLRNTKNQQHLYSANDLFLIQYAHARCCSLLRLASREGLITLSESSCSADTADRRIIIPNPIPWLNVQNQLRLVNLTEYTLISQLVTTLDTLSGFTSETPPTQVVKLATDLSQDLLTFYSENRIWGKIRTKNIALAQARLGLIQGTQTVLKLLLEKALGVFSPNEI